MPIPDKIPIERIEDYHTHWLGQSSDGRQFWGYSTFIWAKAYADIIKENADWQDFRHEYAIIHIFDKEGNHLETKHFFCGTTKQNPDQLLQERIEQVVCEIGRIEFKDIIVKPFKVKINDLDFGLIPDENLEHLNLEPGSQISFGFPWDGSYDT